MKKTIAYILFALYFTFSISQTLNIYATETATTSQSGNQSGTSQSNTNASDAEKPKTDGNASSSSTDSEQDTSEQSGDSEADGEKKEDEEEEEKEYIPHSKLMLMVDGNTDLVMYEKNANQQFNPGGLVKILTAITAIELCDDLTKEITVEDGLLSNLDYTLGNIGLVNGETMTVDTVIRAMMVYDAADCALLLANTVGKSYSSFINSMNAIAKKAGAEKSKFTEPIGIDDKNQKTTLFDMYKISKYAMSNLTFAEIAKLDHLEIPPSNKHQSKRTIFSKNQFLTTYYSLEHRNSYMVGVKNYYTSNEDCGVIANYKNSQNNLFILCACSDSDDDNIYSYNDVEYLLEYEKYNYTLVTLIGEEEFIHESYIPNGKDTNKLLIMTENMIQTKLPATYDISKVKKDFVIQENITAPIQKREKLGTLTIYYDGMKCGETNLLAYSDIESSTWGYLKYKLKGTFESVYFKILIIGIVLIFIIRTINTNASKKKRRNKQR